MNYTRAQLPMNLIGSVNKMTGDIIFNSALTDDECLYLVNRIKKEIPWVAALESPNVADVSHLFD